MNAYQDFRLFYNQHIHPELLHMEQRRRRLMRLMFLFGLLVLGVIGLQLILRIFAVTLMLFIPIGLGIAYVYFRITVFFDEFKPRIVGLIMDFIDNDVNYTFESYNPKGFIPKKTFLTSRIFTKVDDYAGEDLIKGQVREMPFELCELRVQEFSPVRDQLDYVFRGVFLVGDFKRWDMQGGLLLLPDAYRKYLFRSAQAFHLEGGRRVRTQLMPEFEVFFDTWATPNIRLADVLSEDLQRAILQFRHRFLATNRQKEIYASVIGDKIYLALTQDRDLMEPSLFSSNTTFEQINEYYEDLRMLLEVVRDIDVTN